MWPSARVQRSALWRLTATETDEPRARVVRRKETRKMVREATVKGRNSHAYSAA